MPPSLQRCKYWTRRATSFCNVISARCRGAADFNRAYAFAADLLGILVPEVPSLKLCPEYVQNALSVIPRQTSVRPVFKKRGPSLRPGVIKPGFAGG